MNGPRGTLGLKKLNGLDPKLPLTEDLIVKKDYSRGIYIFLMYISLSPPVWLELV